jgi:cysteine desulfuration protein SufE
LDVDALFEGLQLEEHLSPNRHVGVYAIVNKMKAQAAGVA